MSPEVLIGLVASLVTAAVAWAIRVEAVLSRHNTILDKLDELISLLLEDRIRNGTTPTRTLETLRPAGGEPNAQAKAGSSA